jgi:hypothetical protein
MEGDLWFLISGRIIDRDRQFEEELKAAIRLGRVEVRNQNAMRSRPCAVAQYETRSRHLVGARSARDDLLTYSVRNASIGSILDALHAGTRQASVATPSSVAATLTKIVGSSGRVP